jgi:ABC-2 type transport system ATP-binding protein/ribosome-dependent ATPase
MTGPLLSASGATRRFGELLAVDRVDLEVRAGEVVGLVGANGAGKTTLIRMLLGLLHPSAGEVRLLGETPSRRSRARLGYVPQGLGLYEDLTVAENLAFTSNAFGLRLHGPLPDQDLEAARDELVAGLPLGLRRRLAFAAALGHRPELLVLDEPTSGVDALGRARLWDAIRSAAEQGAGVLVTTHAMGEAEQCDRLVVMATGRVVAQGTIEAIIGDATTVAVGGISPDGPGEPPGPEGPRGEPQSGEPQSGEPQSGARVDRAQANRAPVSRWEEAFAACEAAGLPVALVGTELRVPAADPGRVRAVLEAAGISAEVTVTRATLEEAFVLLAGEAAA